MVYAFEKGTVAGTGAAINIPLGLDPKLFKIQNPARGVSVEWYDNLADGEGVKFGGCSVLSNPGAAMGTTKPNIANVAFNYTIAGMSYAKAAVAAGTAPTATTVPQNKYGAFGFQINAAGTISSVDAAGNATGYATAALALAALKAAAVTAANVLAFAVVVINTSGDFVGATTNLDAAGVTAVYHNFVQLRPVGLISKYTGVAGTTARGVTLGTDTDINVSGDTLYYEAWR